MLPFDKKNFLTRINDTFHYKINTVLQKQASFF